MNSIKTPLFSWIILHKSLWHSYMFPYAQPRHNYFKIQHEPPELQPIRKLYSRYDIMSKKTWTSNLFLNWLVCISFHHIHFFLFRSFFYLLETVLLFFLLHFVGCNLWKNTKGSLWNCKYTQVIFSTKASITLLLKIDSKASGDHLYFQSQLDCSLKSHF